MYKTVKPLLIHKKTEETNNKRKKNLKNISITFYSKNTRSDIFFYIHVHL